MTQAPELYYTGGVILHFLNPFSDFVDDEFRLCRKILIFGKIFQGIADVGERSM